MKWSSSQQLRWVSPCSPRWRALGSPSTSWSLSGVRSRVASHDDSRSRDCAARWRRGCSIRRGSAPRQPLARGLGRRRSAVDELLRRREQPPRRSHVARGRVGVCEPRRRRCVDELGVGRREPASSLSRSRRARKRSGFRAPVAPAWHPRARRPKSCFSISSLSSHVWRTCKHLGPARACGQQVIAARWCGNDDLCRASTCPRHGVAASSLDRSVERPIASTDLRY
jgi:hypothetical protein